MRAKNLDPSYDPRLKSHWTICSSSELKKSTSKNSVAVVSYADDEGIRLNGGRPGAAEGPAQILYYLGRMVLREKTPEIIVISDRLTQLQLSERHEAAEKTAQKILGLGYRLITLGGGHDYGYPDAAAFLRSGGSKVLNIDAHMDVRPIIDGKLNSGTAFSRLIEKFGGKALVEWGIQFQTNAESQIQWAQKKGVKVFGAEKPLPQISGNLGLSFCLDAFSGIRGVSAPSIVGLDPQAGSLAIRKYGMKSKWLGLYECSPRLDPVTEDSARLAALFAYQFIHS